MNPFVNDQKRDLELPEGCKDLVDVLQMTESGSEPKSKWKLVHDLKEAERFLATLLLSPARLGNLYIAVPRQEQYVQITYGSGGLTVALSIIGGTPGPLRAVRSLFHHAGVVPIADQT